MWLSSTKLLLLLLCSAYMWLTVCCVCCVCCRPCVFTGSQALRQLSSPGKSGSMFLLSGESLADVAVAHPAGSQSAGLECCRPRQAHLPVNTQQL